MKRLVAGAVFDLLAATNSGSGDDGILILLPDRRQQMSLGHGQRNIIMFNFIAKGAGHTAAARVNLGDGMTGQLQRPLAGVGTDEGFLVAVAVQ